MEEGTRAEEGLLALQRGCTRKAQEEIVSLAWYRWARSSK